VIANSILYNSIYGYTITTRQFQNNNSRCPSPESRLPTIKNETVDFLDYSANFFHYIGTDFFSVSKEQIKGRNFIMIQYDAMLYNI
jgi:hypothetical protein